MELIYPANRIVVNYNETEAMVYLDAYDLRSYKRVGEIGFAPFKQFTPSYNYFFSAPARFPHITLDNISTILNGPWPNFEGFVVIFSNGCRVKFKTKEYCELHRIKFGLTPLAVWEAMLLGTIENYAVQVPEEFRTLFNSIYSTLKMYVDTIRQDASMWLLTDNKNLLSRKELAFELDRSKYKYRNIIWMLYAQKADKEIEQSILKIIRPNGNVL
jgi:hypothetical protein